MRRQKMVRSIARVSLVFALVILLFIVSFAAVKADTQVGGPIVSDTTWTVGNSPYIVIESVDVLENVTLTIEPGVIVKFESGKSLQVNGQLIAAGTANNLISFTSNQTNPSPGDWAQIEFTDSAITTTVDVDGNYISGSILQFCIVEYAGVNVTGAINARSLLVDNCIVRNNDGRGIYNIGTSTEPAWVSNNVVTNNSTNDLYGNSGSIYIRYGTVTNNTVSDNINQGIYAWDSIVQNNTISNNTYGGMYAALSTVSENTVLNNSKNQDGGGIFGSTSTIIGNFVSGNSIEDGDGGGIYGPGSTVIDNIVVDNVNELGEGGGISQGDVISGNTVLRNLARSGGGIYAGSATVSENVISENSARYGGGLYILSGDVFTNTISNNSVSDNAVCGACSDPYGAGAYIYSADFLFNTVVGNTGPLNTEIGGLEINGTQPLEAHYNNFYNNIPYDVTVRDPGLYASVDISGTLNFWGTDSSVNILGQIYDWYDDSDRGKFLYVPYLQETNTDAPFPPPTGLIANIESDQTVLTWDPLPSFTTGWGYKVYYDTDSAIPPFVGSNLNEGNSPIDVGNQTTFMLTGLDPIQDYYFTVTAYDNNGHESWYANVVWKQGGYWIYLPAIIK